MTETTQDTAADGVRDTQSDSLAARRSPFASDRVKRGLLARIRREIRPFSAELYRLYLNKMWGMDIGPDCMISLSARMDKTFPRGIHIGRSSAVNFGAVVLAHDYTRDMHVNTYIGERVQIGACSFIMPGITIGDEVIVAPGSVVMKDVPSNTIVAGNPARPLERGIRTGRWGKLIRDDDIPDDGAALDAVPPIATEN